MQSSATRLRTVSDVDRPLCRSSQVSFFVGFIEKAPWPAQPVAAEEPLGA